MHRGAGTPVVVVGPAQSHTDAGVRVCCRGGARGGAAIVRACVRGCIYSSGGCAITAYNVYQDGLLFVSDYPNTELVISGLTQG